MNPKSISLTYGPSSYALTRKGNHFSRRKIYVLSEMKEIIKQYGLYPSDYIAPTYIEMQLWEIPEKSDLIERKINKIYG